MTEVVPKGADRSGVKRGVLSAVVPESITLTAKRVRSVDHSCLQRAEAVLISGAGQRKILKEQRDLTNREEAR